jgi:hypothetical protein
MSKTAKFGPKNTRILGVIHSDSKVYQPVLLVLNFCFPNGIGVLCFLEKKLFKKTIVLRLKK